MAEVGINVVQRRDQRFKKLVAWAVRLLERSFRVQVAIGGDRLFEGGELGGARTEGRQEGEE